MRSMELSRITSDFSDAISIACSSVLPPRAARGFRVSRGRPWRCRSSIHRPGPRWKWSSNSVQVDYHADCF